MRKASTLLAALSAMVAVGLPASAQTQGRTSSAQIQVWNVSLKLVNSTRAEIEDPDAVWRTAFRRMASSDYAFRPDLITVLEVPFRDKGFVDQRVEEILGEGYGHVHSDYGVSFCETNRHNDCGNTMLFWRSARFSKARDASGDPEVTRWPQFSKNGDDDCDDPGDVNNHNGSVVHDQIAMRLDDVEHGKAVVLAGLHLAAGAPTSCVAKNLEKVSDRLEYTWSNRPLTVVTGDLNERVDIHAGDGTARSHWRPETDTACWYEQFSALHPDRDACQRFSSWYYDAIWAENAEANPDPGICPHWTYGNHVADYSQADSCESPRGRIDYVWIRYEDDSGIRQELSHAQIREKIDRAGADRGYYESSAKADRYSDHRALHMLITW